MEGQPPIDGSTRVCARCGRPGTDMPYCVCGANLDVMREMLPTRAEWEAANADLAANPPPPSVGGPPAPPETERPPRRERRRQRGPGRPSPGSPASRGQLRKQVLASIAIVAVFAIFLIAGSGSKKKPATAGRQQASSPAAASTHTSAPSAADPTVGSCTTAWNGGRSATHRHILDLRLERDRPAVAAIATYAGPAVRLARFGGGSQVVLASRACILIAHHLVFIEQPNASWGLVRAQRGYPFPAIAASPAWARDHANANVKTGPLPGGPADVGAATQKSGTLVILTAEDVGRRP